MRTRSTSTRRTLLRQSASMVALGLSGQTAIGQTNQQAPGPTAAPGEPGPSKLWPTIRQNLFGNRQIQAGEPHVIRLDAPRRAADAGIVPIAFWVQPASALAQEIHKIHLIIDENPQPVALVLEYAPGHEPIGMETRVRIEAYSHVRAIAQARDGGLWESLRYVKASGGCSAAPPADAATIAATGRMQLRLPEVLKAGEPALAQLVILHPNDSGLAMNQVTRLFQPAHYLYGVEVKFDGTLVWVAEINFSLSENPNFLFRFTPRSPGTLTVAATDTRGQRFEAQFPVRMA